jgi:diguanylate cyclase (GGDEF)-like protein/PAS domain S-box-containing protein
MKPAKSGSGARKKKDKSANEIIEEPAGRKGKQSTQLKNDPGPSGWVKGLDYFFNFSKLVDSKNASLRKIYQGAVDLIPPAWQYPEVTCAKLVIDDREFSTENYQESKWQLKGDITINKTKVGFLVVGYLLEEPRADEGPFLNAERYLLNVICERLGQVAARKQMEALLQETDVRYHTLVDDVKDGVYICDTNGTFIYANHALAGMLGLERPSDIIGRKFMEFLPPEKVKKLTDQYRNAMSTGNDSDLITTEVIKPDGTNAFIEIKPSTFITGDRLIGNQGVVRDITERKQAEMKVNFLSTHDALTGLFNRAFFDTEMKRIDRGRQFPISIVLIDVEDLKEATNEEGIQLREKLLKRVAQVLFASFRGDDIVARIGENEFALLLTKTDDHAADEIIKRIRVNLQKKIIEKEDAALRLCIGASTTKEGVGLNAVLKQAEEFLYLDKKKHK